MTCQSVDTRVMLLYVADDGHCVGTFDILKYIFLFASTVEKQKKLEYECLQFCQWFCMGVKLGLRYEGRNIDRVFES